MTQWIIKPSGRVDPLTYSAQPSTPREIVDSVVVEPATGLRLPVKVTLEEADPDNIVSEVRDS